MTRRLTSPESIVWRDAQIKRMQDFLSERGLYADYLDWTLGRPPMIPDWLAVPVLFLGIGIGWIGRMKFEAEARRDEHTVDDALDRAWRAGWRSAGDKRKR